jgi:4-amino-4-deoxychorismate lyase
MQHTLPLIAVNGVIGAQVSPLDRGFAYGDGVFETCRMINAKIPLWDFHKERLLTSCKKLFIAVELHLIETQLNDLISFLDAGDTNATIKIIVTRGQGGRGYSIPNDTSPTIVIGAFAAASYPEPYFSEGVAAQVCKLRLSCSQHLAGLKHLNRLEQVLARAEWNDENIAEGILFDTNNYLVEGVFSNIFLVKNNELFTPNLSESGVAGVMRRVIIENIAPELSIKTHIGQYDLQSLVSADEVFLSNSNYGIWPVRKILTEQAKEFIAGEITHKLQTHLNKIFFS